MYVNNAVYYDPATTNESANVGCYRARGLLPGFFFVYF